MSISRNEHLSGTYIKTNGAVAGYYISDSQGTYPTVEQVLGFVRKKRLKLGPSFYSANGEFTEND